MMPSGKLGWAGQFALVLNGPRQVSLDFCLPLCSLLSNCHIFSSCCCRWTCFWSIIFPSQPRCGLKILTSKLSGTVSKLRVYIFWVRISGSSTYVKSVFSFLLCFSFSSVLLLILFTHLFIQCIFMKWLRAQHLYSGAQPWPHTGITGEL